MKFNWNLPPISLASSRQIAENFEATGMNENTNAAKAGGRTARRARQQLENQTGKSVVSGEN